MCIGSRPQWLCRLSVGPSLSMAVTPSNTHTVTARRFDGMLEICLLLGIIIWIKGRGKGNRQRRHKLERGGHQVRASVEILTPKESEKVEASLLELVGVGLITAASPAWHVLPLFIDFKIETDPRLPGLSEETLPITTTAIFVGWLVSAPLLDRALEIFEKKELLVLHVIGLLMVNLATVTLPHLTAGNLVAFTTVRFAHGLLMNITALESLYMAEKGPGCLVLMNITYSMVTILMSWSCGRITTMMDWRLEAFLWCSVPMMIGLVIAFPNWRSVVQSFPAAISKKSRKKSHTLASHESVAEDVWASERKNILSLAVGFFACGCGFYGLTYSAGQLSTDAYLSCIFLHAADIIGYLLAASSKKYGRNNVQTCGFLLAAISLCYCGTGKAGSFLVLSAAVVGRLCLDVCFTTVYLALAEIFSGSGSKVALTVCETMARFGGIIAPLCGTLPPSISCSIFATVCLAAAGSTITLPEKAPSKKIALLWPLQRAADH